jgi:hypothetical protein
VDNFQELTAELLEELETWTGEGIAADLKEKAHSALIAAKTQPLVNALEWIASVSAREYEYQSIARDALNKWRANHDK